MRGFQPCPTCPSPQECSAAGVCMMEAAGAGGAGGAGGAPPPPPPVGMKKGGKVKPRKKYATGGAVRGAGVAKKGTRKCKMT